MANRMFPEHGCAKAAYAIESCLDQRAFASAETLEAHHTKASACLTAAVASIALTVVPTAFAADTPAPVATAPLKVVVLPIRAQVTRVGFVKGEEVAEWSAAARANLETALHEVVAQSSALELTAPPPVSAEETSAIDEFIAVANLAATQFGGACWYGRAGAYRATADLALGPSLSFLRDRTGADYAIGMFAVQVEQSKSLSAVGTILTLSPLAGANFYTLPAVSCSYVTMFIADLGTGELRWLNAESGYEVAGFNFTDLRDPDSARKLVGKVLEKYPDEPRTGDGRKTRTAGPTRPISPEQGEFAVQAPAGWRVNYYDNLIRATRDGRALNEIHVELRDHQQSFLEIGRRSTRYSSAETLAEWFVEHLEQQKLPELRIIEVSTDAQLVGKPAFRVRHSYRLPDFVGGARIEFVTIGTAVPNGLLIARLDAPQLGYFAKALPAFEEAVQSIVLKPRRHLH